MRLVGAELQVIQFLGVWAIVAVGWFVTLYLVRETRADRREQDRQQNALVGKVVEAVESSARAVEANAKMVGVVGPALQELAASNRDIRQFMISQDSRMNQQTELLRELVSLMRDTKAQLDRIESVAAKKKSTL